jgi:hypothetical protein
MNPYFEAFRDIIVAIICLPVILLVALYFTVVGWAGEGESKAKEDSE